MKTSIISIGNSKGIRIPKVLLEESGIDKEVELKLSKDGIKIIPIKYSSDLTREAMVVSETSFRKDWDRPEEDEAWKDL